MFTVDVDASDRDRAVVRLQKDGKTISEESGKDIVSAVKELLKNNAVDLSSIKEFTLARGCKSFTGLRVGTSVVNALNWALKTGKGPITPKYEPSRFDN